MREPPPPPDEFRGRPDSYEDPVPAYVDAEYYRDGQLVHSTLRDPQELPEEQQPGWTVQGGRRGEAP